jgi:hypothetical protein
MAKVTGGGVSKHIDTAKVKRKGIHSKCKSSKLKSSKNYHKAYRGQGK